jgi:hypothetical protein
MISQVSISELLFKLGAQSAGNVWTVLIIDRSDSDMADIVENIIESIEVFTEYSVGSWNVQANENSISSETDYEIIWNVNHWTAADWKSLDYQRSQLDRHKQGGSFILSESMAKLMMSAAPNLASWIGSRVYKLILDAEILSNEDCEVRLQALRSQTGLSDEQVIQQAQAKQLPRDPEYGEWLVLLGRSDLLES